jgi:hypothetical protein
VIRRLALISLWLLGGHAAWLALFWGLLQVPESSIWMLALSATLVVVLVVLAASLHAGALAAWDEARPAGQALLSGGRHVVPCLLATLLFGLIWWTTGALLEWHTRVSGQIDAAFIARTGRTNTAWIHAAIVWTVALVRWSLGLTLAVSLLGALVAGGVRAAASVSWLRAAFRPRRLLTVTACFALLVALPWSIVDWRPKALALGVEPWFVGTKFIVLAATMAAGWSLVLRAGRVEAERS